MSSKSIHSSCYLLLRIQDAHLVCLWTQEPRQSGAPKLRNLPAARLQTAPTAGATRCQTGSFRPAGNNGVFRQLRETSQSPPSSPKPEAKIKQRRKEAEHETKSKPQLPLLLLGKTHPSSMLRQQQRLSHYRNTHHRHQTPATHLARYRFFLLCYRQAAL